MHNKNTMAGVYDTPEEVEQYIIKLKEIGYDMKKLSIIGTDRRTDGNIDGYYHLADPMKKWDNIGTFWEGLWGLLFGSAFFFIPGIGSLFIAGFFVVVLMGALDTFTIDDKLTVLGTALVSIGISNNNVLEYETEIKAGKLMLMAHGTEAEVEKAREILGIETHVTV